MATNRNTPTQSTLKAGQKFSKLTAISFVRINNDRRPVWKWLCECGRTHEISAKNVLSGATRSCGCLHDKNAQTHGLRKAPEYEVWAGMVQRCTNPNHQNFSYYGGRGITVCDRWMKFAEFYEDMGPRPSPKHTIERVQNDGLYCKENCKWATRVENASNTRRNKYVWHEGKKYTVSGLAATYSMHAGTLGHQLKSGWSIHTALTTKVKTRSRSSRRPIPPPSR